VEVIVLDDRRFMGSVFGGAVWRIEGFSKRECFVEVYGGCKVLSERFKEVLLLVVLILF